MSDLALQLIAEAKATKAKVLDLGMCGLKQLPPALFELVNLEELYLCNRYWNNTERVWKMSDNQKGPNQLSEIPPEFGALKKLKVLFCGGEYKYGAFDISDISVLQYLKQLETLNLSANSVSDIEVLRELPQLKVLYISKNNISNIEALQGLTDLNTLYLSQNKISDIGVLQHLKELQTLYLSENKLVKDFGVLRELAKLTILDLRQNDLSDIEVLQHLPQLEVLYLSQNKISDIGVLRHLSQLRALYLLLNRQIEDFSVLRELAQLTTLDLRQNEMSDIEVLRHLPQLETLYLSNNSIRNIEVLQGLKQVHTLYLNNNEIDDIEALQDLSQLRILDLRHNNVTDIKPLLSLLKKGSTIVWSASKARQPNTINVYNNPCATPPPEIIKQGSAAVIQYFEELDQQGVDHIYEAKLLIVGKGGTGKTTLARKLINADAPMPEEKETTKGIDINYLNFKHKEDKDFTINIWDFGGQEIYHATHQFFLTKRSLYVLLDDTRQDDSAVHDSSFNYWLQTIELFGGDSPVLIVQNEKADRSKEIDLSAIKARYLFLKDCYPTNLLTNRGLDTVKEAIQFYIQQLPHIGESLPKQWLVIRKELEQWAKGKAYTSLERYLDLCSEHQIPEKARALHLSRYLHDLGTFLHFQDHPLLRKTILLQNDWVTDAVYKILDDESIKKANGRFSYAMVQEIWKEDRFCDMHLELLALMQEFELCYPLRDAAIESYMIPQMLPVGKPETHEWDSSQNLQLRYKYGFMPKGLLSRFIVRLHHYIPDIDKAWKSGIVLQKGETFAEVTERYGQQEIMIRVRGENRKNFMTIINEEFEKLHRSFSDQLQVQKFIPCNCSSCAESPDPNFYDHEELKRRIKRDKKTIECNRDYEEVDVATLIFDVFEFSEKEPEEEEDLDDFATPQQVTPLEVFISHADQDKTYTTELIKHLASLQRNKTINTWTPTQLLAGEERQAKIQEKLAVADLVFLLISADFIASDFYASPQMKQLLQKHNDRKINIVPILIRSCDWQSSLLHDLQIIPKDGRAISSYTHNPDEAYNDVITEIKKIIREM